MKKYCIDIDGTICTNTNGNYEKAEPFPDRVQQIATLITSLVSISIIAQANNSN